MDVILFNTITIFLSLIWLIVSYVIFVGDRNRDPIYLLIIVINSLLTPTLIFGIEHDGSYYEFWLLFVFIIITIWMSGVVIFEDRYRNALSRITHHSDYLLFLPLLLSGLIFII